MNPYSYPKSTHNLYAGFCAKWNVSALKIQQHANLAFENPQSCHSYAACSLFIFSY